ncbi:hypothetical protein SAY87_020299 [Trapa incisa]|uniref:Pentatricopeptide repeat-containing protein n=1 Tax=Trapa incisa TaxID=236973 RepID=A0AAN7K0J3_9MYRT|nr:hypothetical protein SAY87_020299 [Trapa incisa]
MAALGRTRSRRLRMYLQRCLPSMARAAKRLQLEDVEGERRIPQRLSPQVRVLVGLGLTSGSLVRATRTLSFNRLAFHQVGMPLLLTSLYSTDVSPDDKQVTDDFWDDTEINLEAYDSQIFKLCDDGDLSSVAKLLATLHRKGVFLGLDSYSLLLTAASKKNDINLSGQAFKHLVASREQLSSASYLDLAKAFLKTPDCTELLRLVKEVSELTFPRSTTIINRIILSFSESRQSDKALLIINNMKALECKPDLITFNTILDMLGCAGRVDEMFNKFAAMKEEGIEPDIISYNTLLNSLRKIGRFDMFEALLKEMEISGVEPDLLTYTALIEAFGRSGNVEQSLRLFSEMKLKQIRPSLYIYRSLMSNLKKMGKVELAKTLLEEMQSSISELARPGDFKPRKRR